MRPFKIFFGLSLAFLIFFFVAKFVIFAFIAAIILSVIYAAFRRIKDFITYDRYGAPYMKERGMRPGLASRWENEAEPLFYGSQVSYHSHGSKDVRFIDL